MDFKYLLSYIYVFVFMCYSSIICRGQDDPEVVKNNIIISCNIHYGSLVKHTKKMDHFTYHSSSGFELNISKQTDGKKVWHQLSNYPEIGLAINYTVLGNSKLLGNAIGVVPFMSFKLLSNRIFSFNLKTGTGLGYLSRFYDHIDNEENIAIGSSFNNATFFTINLEWKLSEKVYLKTGLIHKHYSNGAIKAPNLGLNVPSVFVGVKYIPNPIPEYRTHEKIPDFDKKFHFSFRVAFAVKEDRIPGGPKYPVYITSMAVSRNLGNINRLYAGLYSSFYTPAYEYIVNYEIFDKNRYLNATRIGIELTDEFIFGRIGISGQFGYYLHNPFLKFSDLYNRLGILYYFMDGHLFSGFYLKTHKSTADYLELTIGGRI